MKKIKIYIFTTLFACLFFSYSPVLAGDDNGRGNDGQNNGQGNQGNNDQGNNGRGNGGSDSAPLPINNGVLFLAAAGIAIGYTVIKRKKSALKAE